ncbi:hypothetical protein [Klebsiella oxytoca]|uniref:hypothetical protein n=1 Tax=Klebsiella TaxID=570 RepID=UPI0029340C4A|nr:hypothetical protein [Klebsiella oxytoca]
MSELSKIGAMFEHHWESDGRENVAYLLVTEESEVKAFEVGAFDKKEGIYHLLKKYDSDDFDQACKTYELIVKMSLLSK